MSSSDSDDRGQREYAVRPGGRPGQPPARQPPPQYTRDTMNVYHNELFHDGDVLGGPEEPQASHQGAVGSRPVSAKMQQQKSSLAARRQERMQANIYERNESAVRTVNSPMGAGRGAAGGLSSSGTYTARGAAGMGGAATGGSSVYGLKSSYDPNEESGDSRQQRVVQQPGYSMPVQPRLDLSDIPSFLHVPGPQNGPIMCYIVRAKGSAKMYPKYNLYLDDGKRFLLAARKRKKQTTSNYLISLDYEDLGRESDKFFGKLRSNFVGTDFTIYDNGSKPAKKEAKAGGSDGGDGPNPREELGCITYQYNVLGTRGPRKMTAAIPRVDGQGNRVLRPTTGEEVMLERVKKNTDLEDMVVMRNKPPKWNEELNAYCLNFNGRVTEASVKNFQLVADDNHNHVILQFGKIGKNTFTMDYQWPISALQAFAICLSSFDNKLACE